MMGELSPTEEAILDRALIETYRLKGITPDPETQMGIEPPVMEDLYKVLLGGSEPEARSMADRLEKFIKGSMTGIFDSQSNIDLNTKMTVFSTKNLEDALRPIAFYMILDFIWTRIKKDLKKRLLIIEEAWYLMQNKDSAQFLYGIAKRARKYYLGLTTITQDVDDFLKSEYGNAVVSNSSIQILLKQHPAAIDRVAEVFYLSEGEKRLLLAADRGEGLFFAGANHVAIRVVASDEEHKLITTDPEELLKMREEATKEKGEGVEKSAYRPIENIDLQKYEKISEPEKKVSPSAPAAPPPPIPKKPALQIGMENTVPIQTKQVKPGLAGIQQTTPTAPKPLTSNTPLTTQAPEQATPQKPTEKPKQGLISLGDDGKTKVSQLN
jgi:type IV secretory pathway VirB4 component